MKELPLSIAISALINDKKILLIKRIKGDYIGLWGLPGGKIEKNEHLSEAAIREIYEESGIISKFKSHLGFVSEHLIEKGSIIQHFLLHICELIPQSIEIKNNQEGNLAWFDLDSINEMKEKIIPSDFLMIEKIIKNKESNYFNCVLEKIDNDYILKKFE
jgi:ADP-ribose pyrophosphatase YjhB (NUDIX family)